MKADARSKAAAAGGRAMAAKVLKRRTEAIRGRRKAVASIKKTAVPAKLDAKRSGLVKAAGGPKSRGTLVAEGDSWFDYPMTDVLGCLEDEHGFDVDSVAHKGDRIEEMAYSGGQLEDFTRTIERLLRREIIPKAVLLSGGGNDIAGDDFAVLLNHAKSARPGLNDAVVKGIIDERIRDCYVAILSAVTEICRARLGNPLRIIVHGYGYAVPDGRGFLGGWWILPGPWLKPGFDLKDYGKKARQPVVDALIDRFNSMLKGVSSLPGFGHVMYLDLRSELPSGSNYRDWWTNELHPTERGFKSVARRFANAVNVP
jgi:hypothetical protein